MSSQNPEQKEAAAPPGAPVPEWEPQVADLVWSRIDKSKTTSLGVIIRLPKEDTPLAKEGPSVYCDVDSPDRFSIALLGGDAHVYPPFHYLTAFDENKALVLRCMKAKKSSLTLWDRKKRRAVRDAIAIIRGEIAVEDSHPVLECPECCDEAADEFWTEIQLERGDAHIKYKEELENRRKKAVEEATEREQKQLALKQKKEKTTVKVEKKRAPPSPSSSRSDSTKSEGTEGSSRSGSMSGSGSEDSSSSSSSSGDSTGSDSDYTGSASDSTDSYSRRKRRHHRRSSSRKKSRRNSETSDEDDMRHRRRKSRSSASNKTSRSSSRRCSRTR